MKIEERHIEQERYGGGKRVSSCDALVLTVATAATAIQSIERQPWRNSKCIITIRLRRKRQADSRCDLGIELADAGNGKAAEANVFRDRGLTERDSRRHAACVQRIHIRSQIIMTDESLTALRNNRLFDVGEPEMLPNNTVFRFAHLLYHLNNPVDIRKFPIRKKR